METVIGIVQRVQKDPTKLESIELLGQTRLAEYGSALIDDIYNKIKTSHPTLNWVTDELISKLEVVGNKAKPALMPFQTPIKVADVLLCTGMDMINHELETKDSLYNEIIIQPATNNSLITKLFDVVDSGLQQGDLYVANHLPEDPNLNKTEEAILNRPTSNRFNHTLLHLGIFSEKVAHRIVLCIINEGPLFTQHCKEVLTKIVEAIKNPQAAIQEVQDTWKSLDSDTLQVPQRANNLKELILLLIRYFAALIKQFLSNNPLDTTKEAIILFFTNIQNLINEELKTIFNNPEIVVGHDSEGKPLHPQAVLNNSLQSFNNTNAGKALATTHTKIKAIVANPTQAITNAKSTLKTSETVSHISTYAFNPFQLFSDATSTLTNTVNSVTGLSLDPDKLVSKVTGTISDTLDHAATYAQNPAKAFTDAKDAAKTTVKQTVVYSINPFQAISDLTSNVAKTLQSVSRTPTSGTNSSERSSTTTSSVTKEASTATPKTEKASESFFGF